MERRAESRQRQRKSRRESCNAWPWVDVTNFKFSKSRWFFKVWICQYGGVLFGAGFGIRIVDVTARQIPKSKGGLMRSNVFTFILSNIISYPEFHLIFGLLKTSIQESNNICNLFSLPFSNPNKEGKNFLLIFLKKTHTRTRTKFRCKEIYVSRGEYDIPVVFGYKYCIYHNILGRLINHWLNYLIPPSNWVHSSISFLILKIREIFD